MTEKRVTLDPLPKDGAAWFCAAGLEHGPGLCRRPAAGLLAADVAQMFGVMRAVCEEHRQFIEDEFVDDDEGSST